MQLLTKQQNSSTQAKSKDYVHKWIFVLQLLDGRYVIGSSNNAARRIAILNSGANPAVKANSVYRIVGIKEANEDRTYINVVTKFCQRKGEKNVITV